MPEGDREALEERNLFSILIRSAASVFQGDDDLAEELDCSYEIAH